MSRIMRKYEKYKNYKYLQVINKSRDFDKERLETHGKNDNVMLKTLDTANPRFRFYN